MLARELAQKILALIQQNEQDTAHLVPLSTNHAYQLLSMVTIIKEYCEGIEEPLRHDGKLGGEGRNAQTVCYCLSANRPFVAIGYDAPDFGDEIWQSPEQALSLRNWLIQETPTLLKLAEEVQNG